MDLEARLSRLEESVQSLVKASVPCSVLSLLCSKMLRSDSINFIDTTSLVSFCANTILDLCEPPSVQNTLRQLEHASVRSPMSAKNPIGTQD